MYCVGPGEVDCWMLVTCPVCTLTVTVCRRLNAVAQLGLGMS